MQDLSPPHNSQKSKHLSSTQKALNVWGIVLATWAIYRSTIGVNAPILFDEVLFKPLLFVGPVLWYIKTIERASIAQGLWIRTRHLPRELGITLLIASPLMILLGYSLVYATPVIARPQLMIYVFVALGMTVSEEVLSRGFIARHMWQEKHNIFVTIAQASLLHMFLRIPRMMTTPELFGGKLMAFIVAESILSVVLTALFLWRKNLLPVLGVRYLYTLTLMSLLVA